MAGEHYYPNIGTLVRNYVCHPEGPDDIPETYTVDVTRGVLEDPETLRRDDALAFKTVHYSLDAALRNRVASARPEERVQVALWFAVPRGDLDALAAGAEGGAADALQQAAREELEQRLRERAIALRERLHQIPGVVVLSKVDTILRFGAPYIRMEAPVAALEAVGELPGVVWIGEKERFSPPSSEAYFQGTVTDWLHAAGGDGSFRRVAILEEGSPDYWGNLSGALAGSCGSSGYFCHCPWGPANSHSRQVMSVVRSLNLTFGGIAKSGLTISANTDWTNEGTCDVYAGSNFASAIEWAIENSARIINWSEGSGHNSPSNPGQNILDRYLDYIASTWPYPFIAISAHNTGITTTPHTWVRNATVVGGSKDQGTPQRTDDGLYNIAANNGSPSKNPNPSGGANPENGWELPHLVAPAVNIHVSGNTYLGDQVVSGNSVSTPQVAGIVAGLHELNANLINRPWVTFAGLLASANRNADVALGGAWPLALNDYFDDFDGAGEVNAFAALAVLQSSSKKDGNQQESTVGHDYGTMTSTNPPQGTYYSEVWNASVNGGDTLRVVAHLQATAQCGTDPDSQYRCDDAGTGDSKFPLYFLYIFDGQTIAGQSFSSENNYQIASVINGGGSPKTFQIKLYISHWKGISSTPWGLAWAAGEQD